jgi:iron complex outermembrane receptor protein
MSHSKSFINEAESKVIISSNQSLNVGLNNTYNEAITKNYLKNPRQNRIALFASYRINNKKETWKGTASIRQEFISNGDNPFIVSIGIERWLFKKIRLRGNISKNYRLPTFNDLYWTPGGNPDLLPEKGWTQESGILFIHCVNRLSIEAEVSGFSNKVNNWIIWLPDNFGLWSPKNILSVWSRGLEYDLKARYNINKVKLHLAVRYQFILSTNEKVNLGNETSLQKQLVYVPSEKSQGCIGAEYRGFRLSFSYNYVGYRYTTSDNTQYLKPYHLGNVYVGKEFTLTNTKIKTSVQINNVWRESYEIIAYYPMPGRYYQVGLAISLNQPNNK